jgi:hypothetical protein
MMRVKRKYVLGALAALLLFAGILCGAALYVYSRPGFVKSLAEKAISDYTGLSVTIGELSYGRAPHRLRIRDLRLEPGEEGKGGFLTLPLADLDFALEGPFGRRTLVIKQLTLSGMSLFLTSQIKAVTWPETRPSSLLLRLAKSAFALFAFREIKFEAAQMDDGRIEAAFGDRLLKMERIEAHLTPEHALRVSSTADLNWEKKGIRASTKHVQITTETSVSLVEPDIKAVLEIRDSTAQTPAAEASGVDLEADLVFDMREMKLTFGRAQLHMASLVLTNVEGGTSPPLDGYLELQGSYLIRTGRLHFSLWRVEIPRRFHASGNLALAMGSEEPVKVTVKDGEWVPEEWRPFLPASILSTLAPFRLTGPVGLSGDLMGVKEGQGIQWRYDLDARFKENGLSVSREDQHLSGVLSGRILAEGTYPAVVLSLAVDAKDISIKGGGFSLKGLSARVAIHGTHPRYTLQDVTVRFPAGAFSRWGNEPWLDAIRIAPGQGSLDVQKATLKVTGGVLSSPLLGDFNLSLTLDPAHSAFHIHGEGPRLAHWPRVMNLVPQDWEIQGEGMLDFRASMNRGKPLSFQSNCRFSGFGFRNPDMVYTAQGMDLEGHVDGSVDPQDLKVSLTDTSIHIRKGEVLLDRFYLDLGKSPFFGALAATIDMDRRSVHLSNLETGLKNLFTLSAQGNIDKIGPTPGAHIRLTMPRVQLNPLFQQFVLEPYRTEKPFLNDLHISGSISAEFDLKVDGENRIVKGKARLEDGRFALGEDGFNLKGLTLALPLWYTATSSTRSWKPLTGKLSVESAQIPFLPEQGLVLDLSAGPNLLAVPSATRIKALGGSLEMGPVLCENPWRKNRTIRTTLSFESVDTGSLLARLWKRPIPSRINGMLDPVEVVGNDLQTGGRLKATLFGGDVSITNIGILNMGTPASDLRMSATFKNLNLAELTRDTAFGKIEGVLEGDIRDLELAYGQPQKFRLRLETVKTEGVPQKISIKAVDNIAQIGGGMSPFMGLAGALVSLFKEFSYEKIGVLASLENDVFKINGTIKEGGKEYLVKRSGLSGVNVINQNPDNRISFKDMVKRIKRVTEEGGGPVVK